MRTWSRIAVGIAALALAASAAVSTAAPALADTVINYSCGPNIDPNNTDSSTRTTVMQKALPNGGYVQLRRGFDAYYGDWVYWTRTVNNSTDHLHLDWSDTGGSTYHICKTLYYHDSNSSYTYGVNNPGGRVYKAFAEIGSTWYGSSSWYSGY